ncbi:MAG TPA: hexitol phosphatase HxpB [Candidatus Saccharimonadales bacterium]|nr:hexitol phosphatase HxpB [Candidatus Saccharimonadales bacterium]
MIEAVIFDMDGLLVDSEPVWREVEVELFNELGVPLNEQNAAETMGLRADEVVQYWYQRYPWQTPSTESVTENLLDRMVEEVSARDIALPGVQKAFEVVEEAGLPAAIASSSPSRLIYAAIHRLAITDRLQVIQSAEHEPYGKPHPGVYIKAAENLGVHPERCLAFEDSPNGALSAKAAKMKCIAIPEEIARGHANFSIADKVLGSLLEFDASVLEELSA